MSAQRKVVVFAIPALALTLLAGASIYTIQEGHQAIILEFGRLVNIEKEPGLKFKIPFVQDVISYDRRILDFDINEFPVILRDQKRLLVSTFSRYRIASPETFYKTVRSEQGARDRLKFLNESFVLSVLGKYALSDVLSPKRDKIAKEIMAELNKASLDFGIEIVDLRLWRTDLPAQNSEAIFNRMISEREQEAQEFRSKGEEISREIKAQADRERTVLVADAQKQSEITRGQGDAEAVRLAAAAFGADEAFFNFYQAMRTYNDALTPETTTYILSPKGDFFKHFNKF